MEKDNYRIMIVILIIFLFLYTPYFIMAGVNTFINATGKHKAQEKFTYYFTQKYPAHKISIINLHYSGLTRHFECSAKDEVGIVFSAELEKDSTISDRYIESKVKYELENKLSPFIKKSMESIYDPYFQVESPDLNDENGKYELRLDITLPNKSKIKIKTVKEFSAYAYLVKNEILRLLGNGYRIDELCIRLNSFVVSLNINQLNYEAKDIENATIFNSGI